MGKGGYKVVDQGAMYFVSFAVVGWIDVFSRKEYRDLVIESLKYCKEKKGLVIYVWCIMSNHVHLIISAKESNISDVLGDFKKFTSKQILKAIIDHPGESRRECLPDWSFRRGCLKFLRMQESQIAGIPITSR